MPGGWGVPCVPAHEPYFYIVCHLAETLGHTTGTQTPRTYLKPCEHPPAPAPVMLICHAGYYLGWPFGKGNIYNHHQTSPPNNHGITAS